jgi:hypothetical protein
MPRRRREPQRRRRPIIFRNRRNPRSRWIAFSDMVLNAKEWLYGFWYRVPKGSALKWRRNKIISHTTRHY